MVFFIMSSNLLHLLHCTSWALTALLAAETLQEDESCADGPCADEACTGERQLRPCMGG